MQLTACQLDEIRAKQREDEAVRRLSTRLVTFSDLMLQRRIAQVARLAKAEVNAELSRGEYTMGTSIKA